MGKNFAVYFWQAIGCSLLSGTTAVADDIRQPVNFFVMQALHDENVLDSVLSSDKLQGIHIRDDWRRVEPQSNVMSFSWIDDQIARAKSLGKQVTLGVYTGNNSPTWLSVPRVDGVPIPWNPTVIAAHNELVAELGKRYRNETAIAAVHISSPATNASLEMHYPAGLTSVAGYSDAVIIDVWKSAIDAYAAAFPHNALVVDVAIEPNDSGGVTFPVIDYAREVLGSRANFIHCSLKASTNVDAPHHAAIVELGEDGARIGFEMVSPSIDQERFGGLFSTALALGQQAGAAWYQVYQADVPLLPDPNAFVGDFNRDNVVDAADYTVWRNTLGSSNTLAADGDGSKAVDSADYDVWRQNYGNSTTGGTSSGDFNHDGVVDAADYTVWRNSLGSIYSMAADGDGSETIDSGDYNVWRQNYGISTDDGASAGDFNLDGLVDAADYTVWRNSLGNTAELLADGDANGQVDLADYENWKRHYGLRIEVGAAAQSRSAQNAIPEPSGMLLSIAWLLCYSSVHLRRCRRR